ncbi:MAG: helix-turn-helix domain-containing protein [Coleofasciculus sp. C3-bin4]|nr:helix-turn-helix domain-containing protein [Coleofasciculus sp. C3-bin4]
MLSLTYVFKLKVTPEQVPTFRQGLEVCRKVGNFALCEIRRLGSIF